MRISEELRPLLVPSASLKLWPGNAKEHDLDAIWESIERTGFTDPVVVQASTRYVMAGNGRKKSVDRAGIAEIPAVVVDLTDEQAARFVLLHNRSHDLGGYDFARLTEALVSVQEEYGGLEGTGYSDADLEHLLRQAQQSESTLDDLVDELGEPGEDELWPVLELRVPPAARAAFYAMTDTAVDGERFVQVLKMAGWDAEAAA